MAPYANSTPTKHSPISQTLSFGIAPTSSKGRGSAAPPETSPLEYDVDRMEIDEVLEEIRDFRQRDENTYIMELDDPCEVHATEDNRNNVVIIGKRSALIFPPTR